MKEIERGKIDKDAGKDIRKKRENNRKMRERKSIHEVKDEEREEIRIQNNFLCLCLAYIRFFQKRSPIKYTEGKLVYLYI